MLSAANYTVQKQRLNWHFRTFDLTYKCSFFTRFLFYQVSPSFLFEQLFDFNAAKTDKPAFNQIERGIIHF